MVKNIKQKDVLLGGESQAITICQIYLFETVKIMVDRLCFMEYYNNNSFNNSRRLKLAKVSKLFIDTIDTHNLNAYTIAQEAGMTASQLSQFKNGIVTIRENDARIIRVGEVIGLKPEQCFE